MSFLFCAARPEEEYGAPGIAIAGRKHSYLPGQHSPSAARGSLPGGLAGAGQKVPDSTL